MVDSQAPISIKLYTYRTKLWYCIMSNESGRFLGMNDKLVDDQSPSTTFVISHEPAFPHKFGEGVGGAGAVVQKLAVTSTLMGERASVLAPTPIHGVKKIDSIPVPHHFFNKPETESTEQLFAELTTPERLEKLTKLVKASRGDVIHGNYFVAGGVLSMIKDQTNGPFLYLGHSWDRIVKNMDHTREISLFREDKEQLILNTADGIIVSTSAEKKQLAAAYGTGANDESILNKTFVIPLGVEHDIYNPERANELRKTSRYALLPPELQDSLVFYTLGRMSKQKGHLNAIKAFATLMSQEPTLNASLSLFGGPLNNEYVNEMVSYVKALPPAIRNRIVFQAAQPGEIAHAVGDVFVGPSTWETWFLAMSEAMACGKPTITSDLPILRDVAPGSHFINQHDPESIARAMQFMAQYPQRSEELGNLNLKTAQKYTWEHSVAQLKNVIGSFL